MWRERLARPQGRSVAILEDPRHRVARAECASVVRRLCAMLIDLAVIAAVLQAPVIVNVSKGLDSDPSGSHISQWIHENLPAIKLGAHSFLVFLAFFVYSALLVGLGGQTLGMTVMDVRVVTTDFGKPGIVQSLWRYAIAFCSAITSFAIVGFFMRIHPHDRLSGTRLVGGRKAP
jgi:uncharacterized RDD family membrane protein YckC